MDIEEIIYEADKSWDAGTIAQALMKILVANPKLNYSDLEKVFRELRSNTFLVAKPSSIKPYRCVCRFLPSGNPADYWLWICLHGREEMLSELKELNLIEADNMANLAVCGVLTVD